MNVRRGVGPALLGVGCAMLLAVAPAAAAATWSQIGSGTPPARSASAMAYDEASGKLVLFGGYQVDAIGRTTYLDETWTFDGTTWTQAAGHAKPPARAAATMAYDGVTGRVVLYGGFNGRARFNDTWLWDGARGRWTRAKPKQTPPSLSGPMGFQDPATGHAAIFGGYDGRFYQLLTWRWDGRNWASVASATQPYARGYGVIGLNPALGQVVVFGGLADVNPNNTWTWDGTDWTLQNPTTQPPLRYDSSTAYDPSAGGVITFGGGQGLGDTWLWNGTDWSEILPTTSPAPRESSVMAYDAAMGHAVLYGGEDPSVLYDDTWEFSIVP